MVDDRLVEGLETFVVAIRKVINAKLKPNDSTYAYDRFDGFILPSDLSNAQPVFTSQNVVDAYVGTEYLYRSKASDADGDSLEYQIGRVTWPHGFEPRREDKFQFEFVNHGPPDQRGVFTWNPPAELAGQLVTVEEMVWDGANEPVVREFTIRVQPAADNGAPIIVSEPLTDFMAPLADQTFNNGSPVAPSVINLTLANGQQQKVNVNINPQLQGEPTADIVFLIDRSASMNSAIEWLSGNEFEQGALLQIENELIAHGITNNRYGLVVFNQAAFGPVPPPLFRRASDPGRFGALVGDRRLDQFQQSDCQQQF